MVRKIGCECKNLEKAFKYAFDAEIVFQVLLPIQSQLELVKFINENH